MGQMRRGAGHPDEPSPPRRALLALIINLEVCRQTPGQPEIIQAGVAAQINTTEGEREEKRKGEAVRG